MRFVIWGLGHGLGEIVTRIWWWTFGRVKNPTKLRTAFNILLTFIFVVQFRIMFRATDMEHGWKVFLAQFDHWQTLSAPSLSPMVLAILGAAIVGHLLTHGFYEKCATLFSKAPVVVRVLVLLGATLLIQQVATQEAQPFIYFKF
jgi:D-alanyl-lipoteichoic acid acyltransferase DltB (MBOAT superfamily)